MKKLRTVLDSSYGWVNENFDSLANSPLDLNSGDTWFFSNLNYHKFSNALCCTYGNFKHVLTNEEYVTPELGVLIANVSLPAEVTSSVRMSIRAAKCTVNQSRWKGLLTLLFSCAPLFWLLVAGHSSSGNNGIAQCRKGLNASRTFAIFGRPWKACILNSLKTPKVDIYDWLETILKKTFIEISSWNNPVFVLITITFEFQLEDDRRCPVWSNLALMIVLYSPILQRRKIARPFYAGVWYTQ